MTQIDQQIANKIRARRRKQGITQANLSKRLLISPSYLNLMESGKRKINMDLLLKMANELSVNVSDISEKGLYVNDDDQDWGSAGMNDVQEDPELN